MCAHQTWFNSSAAVCHVGTWSTLSSAPNGSRELCIYSGKGCQTKKSQIARKSAERFPSLQEEVCPHTCAYTCRGFEHLPSSGHVSGRARLLVLNTPHQGSEERMMLTSPQPVFLRLSQGREKKTKTKQNNTQP